MQLFFCKIFDTPDTFYVSCILFTAKNDDKTRTRFVQWHHLIGEIRVFLKYFSSFLLPVPPAILNNYISETLMQNHKMRPGKEAE